MGDQSYCHVSFWSQANALLRKNLTFQKRNIKRNIWLISFPIILCLLTLVLQRLSDQIWDEPAECGCSKEGSEFSPGYSNFEDPAFTLDPFIYSLQRHCPPDFNFSVFVWNASDELRQEALCVEGLPLWRNSSSKINGKFYKGYVNGNSEGKTNEIFAAYGFSNSNEENFNVVYMDEPSTGLDPASRKNLWNVIKCALQDRAMILATHSMQEAEVLCDRVGIFVDGSLQCLGNPKELIGRYGGPYVFTITTSSIHEEDVEKLVRTLSPSANKIYHVSGIQKFELPKTEIRMADIFKTVEIVKSKFTSYASNLADATLEEVFIKVACGAQEANA